MKTILHASHFVKHKQEAQAVLTGLFLFFSSLAFAQNPCPPGKVQICHKGKNIICVSPSAVAAHLAHGDKLGSCTPSPCTVTATGGKITCARPSVPLSAVSGNTGASFSWAGPNGFVSVSANPVVTIPGIYTVTVSSPTCTAISDTALVIRDVAAPTVTATGGTITCSNPTVVLKATSSVSGSGFKWTGPNGFTSTSANPNVQAPGTYVVTATNPATGCTASNAAVVQQSINAPVILTVQASGSGSITCANPSVVLTATTTSTNVKYKWTGPNDFISDSAMPVVTQPGTYQLQLSNIGNGCSSTASIQITQNTVTPAEVSTIPSVLGTLTCAESNLVLTGGSATTGVAYNWTGPSGFASSSRITKATVPGIYTLMVTDTSNGCGSQATISVEQNIATPAGVTASNSEPLTCFTTEVSLMGSSSTMAVSYSWTGPDGFVSSSPTTTTGIAGKYTLTITDLENGCMSIASTTVEQNTAAPADVTINSGYLTCDNAPVTLLAGSSTANVDYNWFGPDGYFAATAETTTTTPGEYLLMVTNQVNGCTMMMTTVVEQDLSECMTITNRQAPLAEAAAEAKIKTVELTIYPNPIQNKAIISFKIPESGKVTVAIYSAMGVSQKLLFSQQAHANHLYQLPVDASKFAKGIYYCVITVNNKQYSKKMVVMP